MMRLGLPELVIILVIIPSIVAELELHLQSHELHTLPQEDFAQLIIRARMHMGSANKQMNKKNQGSTICCM